MYKPLQRERYESLTLQFLQRRAIISLKLNFFNGTLLMKLTKPFKELLRLNSLVLYDIKSSL